MKLAAAQITTEVGDVQANLNCSLARIEEAAAHGADLVCFPESVLDGYACESDELPLWSRALRDPEIRDIQAAARKARIWVMWSLAEKVDSGIANTAILIGRDGQIAMTYRKTHLCAEDNEAVAYTPGISFDVVSVEGLNVGAMICYDRHFPEVARTIRLKGADLILHPTATDWFSEHSRTNSINTAMMRTRAYENRAFILSVNRANDGGGSALFGPDGSIISLAGPGEEMLYCDVDVTLKHKNRYDLMAARRPSIYSPR